MVTNTINKKVAWVIDQLESKRKELGISHERLAKRAKLDTSTISLIESRKRTPTIATLFKICEALDISLGEIIMACEKNHQSS